MNSNRRSRRPKGPQNIITLGNRPLHEKGKDAIRALEHWNKPPQLFVRSGQLIRFRLDEKQRPIVEPVRDDVLKHFLSQAARFSRNGNNGTASLSPPIEVVREVLAQGTWAFPALEAVVAIPIVRPNGTIRYRPGYDADTGLYYAPLKGFEVPDIPERPCRTQLAGAVAVFDDVLHDFPFDSTASRANAIGLFATSVLRPAILGNVPAALIDAPQPGSGKGKLVSIASIICTGRVPANMTAPSCEEEWRKRITSTLRAGNTFIAIDNIEGRLDSASLAAALTTEVWRDRELQTSRNLEVPQKATWVFTGNNIRLGGDIPRRCYKIRLQPKESHAWTRTGFRHPNLEQRVQQQRPALVAAILTMARGWHSAGRPPSPSPILGSFEDWCQVIGGVLAHAGIPDFLGNTCTLHESGDEEGTEWAAFLHAIGREFESNAFTVANLAERMELRNALSELLPEELSNGKQPSSLNRRLGVAFRRRDGRPHGPAGIRVVRVGESHGTAQWKVRQNADLLPSEAPLAA